MAIQKLKGKTLTANVRGDFFINENELFVSFIASIYITTGGDGVNR
jgi:hypothetical protein